MKEIMAQNNSRAKRSEKELPTLTLAAGVTIPDSKMAREVTETKRSDRSYDRGRCLPIIDKIFRLLSATDAH